LCVALGLNDQMIERVIGVAAPHSLLPYTTKGYELPVPALKNNLGWAAAGAVLATDLAIAGEETYVTNALDGVIGRWHVPGSDDWDLEQHLNEKPAVLRVGFKHFPVCWHLQEYLKALSGLLVSIPQEDEVVEIVLSGPQEIEKFCQHDLIGSTDIAFNLPAAFSLLISRVEPGPEWDAVDDRSDTLRYRDVFRYECSEIRSIYLRTRAGLELNATVDVEDLSDPAAQGLDQDGVLAKHKRLTHPILRSEAATALATVTPLSAGGVPHDLYSLISRIMMNSVHMPLGRILKM